MKLQNTWKPLLAAALLFGSFSATATVITVARAERGVIPVLVMVDKSGKVTKIVAT